MSTAAGMAPVPAEPRGFRRLWRVAKQVFHEVMGAAFALLALGWLNSALRALLRQFVSPRTAVVSCSSRLAYSVGAETPLEERVRMADRKPKSGTLPERKARFTTLSGLPL